jgi:methylglutaconyl-CoA hydratase
MTATLEHWPHKDVKFERSNSMAYVTLNRPNENNSMNDTIGGGVTDALSILARDRSVRVAVFTGEGRMFCAGGDPKNWQANALRAKGVHVEGDGTVGNRIKTKQPGPNLNEHFAQLCRRADASGAFGEEGADPGRIGAAKNWLLWSTLPQFTIALVNGSAMGGGVGMVCCCDYVIAVKKAYFVVSEVKIGVIPATISPYVVAKIGPANAKRMFNTAENMKAERAKEIGIVNEVVENMEEGHKRVREICKQMEMCAPEAVAMIKQLVFTCAGQPIAEPLMCFTALQSTQNLKSSEAAEGRRSEINGEMKPWENVPITPLY